VTNGFASSYEAELGRKWQPGKWTIFAGGDHIVYVNAKFIVFTGADANYKEVMDAINAI
jgi:roadblock/LC7 domain-containing protein